MQTSRFERILVCMDGGGREMISLGGRVAAANRGTIRFMACMPEPPSYRSMAIPNYSELASLARQAREEQMHRAVRRLGARGISADWVISGCAAEGALIREIESHAYDLLMVPAEQHGANYTASKRAIHLMRRSPCPVWVVRPDRVPGKPKVVVAVAADGPQDLNIQLLRTSHVLSNSLCGELHVLSVWNAYGESMLASSPVASIHATEVKRYAELTRQERASALTDLLSHCTFAVDNRCVHLIKGDPLTTIPRFCHDIGVAVLVMGTVARTGLIGALLGNTAERISESLPASIVSVRPLCHAESEVERVGTTTAAQGTSR